MMHQERPWERPTQEEEPIPVIDLEGVPTAEGDTDTDDLPIRPNRAFIIGESPISDEMNIDGDGVVTKSAGELGSEAEAYQVLREETEKQNPQKPTLH